MSGNDEPSIERQPYDYAWRKRFPDAREVAAFEGGAVYEADGEAAYWLIKDEGTMVAFMDDGDLAEGLVALERYQSRGDRDAAAQLIRNQHDQLSGVESPVTDTVGDVIERLVDLEQQRLALIGTLRRMGFRSRGFVGEYGELLAVALYEARNGAAQRARASEPGYDLLVKGVGQVQVKTLRSTPTNHRTSMGVIRGPYHVLFALRLDAAFKPTAAWEIPKDVVETIYRPGERTSLTARLIAANGVTPIPLSELEEAARIVAAGGVSDN